MPHLLGLLRQAQHKSQKDAQPNLHKPASFTTIDALKPQRILRLPVQLAQITVEAGDVPIIFRGSDMNECIHNVHLAVSE